MPWQADDLEAVEIIVLGHLLAKSSPMAAIFDVGLEPEDFYTPVHGELFQAMSAQLRTSPRVDAIRLLQALGNEINELGGKDYLKKLRTWSLGSVRAVEAARAVKDAAIRRRIEEGCAKAATLARDSATSLDDVQSALHETLREAVSMKVGASHERLGDILPEYFAELQAMQQRGGVLGLASPFPDLDFYTGGFLPGEVVILAGRPGTGKTALGLNLAVSAAKRGITTGVFSLEMPAKQLVNRIMSSCARVNAQRFRDGRFSRTDWESMHASFDDMANIPLLLADQSQIRPSQIREKCRIWQQEHGLGFLVLDYLQLITPESRNQNREREVADISRIIKTTATDLKIPILLLAQLNRLAEGTKRPLLSHLRESGAVEQDADIVLFLVPWNVAEAGDYPVIELDIAKGRGNACGTVKLVYDKRHLLFGNYQAGEDAA